MKKTAIIGAGIAGLGCAYFLHPRHDLTIYEQNDYAGGHTNTVTIMEKNREVPIDTGFMVYNEVTYPNLTRLFRELNVAVKPTSMSFSMRHDSSGLEYCGSSLNHLFAQRKNLLNPRFWKMILQINRFNHEAVAALKSGADAEISLRDYASQRNYGADFLNLYLIPMSAAVWSTPPPQMLEFPAFTLLRFFHNHGFLGLDTQHPWLTVTGGAKSYVAKITAPLRDRVKLNRGAATVRREAGRVKVTDNGGQSEIFDQAILACHADQSLKMLADTDTEEQNLLAEFKYQSNDAFLHTDDSVMPNNRRCWSSWNYRIGGSATSPTAPSTIYWMNSLQGVSDRQNYFVSINGEEFIKPATVLKKLRYEHPLFSLGAVRAQKKLPALNARRTNVYFCGSYFRYGFHEDAFTSALDLCRLLEGSVWN